jgi:hypothetical protein
LSQTLHISPEVLDFLSNYDIILASVSGSSNKEISRNLDVSEKEVRQAIADYIGKECDGWDGFEESSTVSPYFVFKALVKTLGEIPSESEFSDEMERLTGDNTFLGLTFSKIYQIVMIFSTMRYKYLNKYRKEDYGNYISRHTEEITKL